MMTVLLPPVDTAHATDAVAVEAAEAAAHESIEGEALTTIEEDCENDGFIYQGLDAEGYITCGKDGSREPCKGI